MRASRLLLVPAALYLGWRGFRLLPPESKQGAVQLVNRTFQAGERIGLMKRNPGFRTDYLHDYPELGLLEQSFDTIRRECLGVLDGKARLPDMQALGGDAYTTGGIHTISWKTFMFKSGEFIEENCALCPETAALLRRIPGVYTAFFSILDPHQYVRPHWGYYKGYLRYHLGVVIPNDNEDQKCFLRINDSPGDNARRDKALVERGAKYYWREGEGVLFDDTFLHDAANESGEVRVVLWLDIARHMSWPLELLNRVSLWVAYNDPSVKAIARNAVVAP